MKNKIYYALVKKKIPDTSECLYQLDSGGHMKKLSGTIIRVVRPNNKILEYRSIDISKDGNHWCGNDKWLQWIKTETEYKLMMLELIENE